MMKTYEMLLLGLGALLLLKKPVSAVTSSETIQDFNRVGYPDVPVPEATGQRLFDVINSAGDIARSFVSLSSAQANLKRSDWYVRERWT